MIRRWSTGLVLLLGALYGVLLVGSLTASPGTVFLAAAATYVVDALLHRDDHDLLQRVLDRASAGVPWRFFIRKTLIVVLLFRADAMSTVALGVVVGAVLAHHLVLVLHGAMTTYIGRRSMRRLETRNLAVPGEVLPSPPRPWLTAGGSRLLLHADLLLVAALGWAVVDGSYRLMAPAALLTVVAAAAVPLALAPHVLALLRLPDDEVRFSAAQQAVLDLSPVVILYFSGGLASVYQVNMWLETMERLDRRVLVLLRERRYLDQLGTTTVPVLCLPFSVDLMNFQMPSARVALYVANVGRNIHLLRVPALKTAFIGHGDSDKTASFNPATKVYDEVWVAGEAGRQRYVRAQVGVREDEIVLVGRPQLDGIHEAVPRPDGAPYRVLYAPTWEGWTEDPHHSSLVSMGREIVRLLLATPGIQVVYKPHPLTGTVDPRASLVSGEIVRMLAAAGSEHVAVLDNARPLYDCFNDSDALITDISSVVSDYLRSEKPYFVTNGAGLADDAFRELNPSAGAAYLIGPDAIGLTDGLQQARGADGFRGRRRTVRAHLLGDPNHDPMTLFRRAVDDLTARADEHLRVVGRGGGDDDTGFEMAEGVDAPPGTHPNDVQAKITLAG